MSVNDLNHDILVENQVGQLQATLTKAAADGQPGAEVSQPITLGSDGAPPFASQDGSTVSSTIGSVNSTTKVFLGANSSVSYTLAGPTGFHPPLGFGISKVANLPKPAGVCVVAPASTMTCGGFNSQYNLKWNFSAGNNLAYSVSLQGGSAFVGLNYSTNSSTITISGLQGFHVFLTLYGNHNSFNPQGSGGSTPITINVTGSFNTINLAGLTAGGNTIKVNIVGNNNLIIGTPTNGGNTEYFSIIGAYNTLSLTPGGGDKIYTYFTGFDAGNATSVTCPYGTLGFSNVLTGVTNTILNSQNAHLYQFYNNSTAFNNPSVHNPGTHWQVTNQTASNFLCPYVQSLQLPFSFSQSAELVVHLRNTYAPVAEVAYDEGAVVLAQSGGNPIMVDGPQVAYTGTSASLWIPSFVGAPGTTAGISTVDVLLRLVSVESFALPANLFSLSPGGAVTVVVNTPYAIAWGNYFANLPAFAGHVSCSPAAKAACLGPYAPGGSLGTVTISLPTTGLQSFTIQVAQFAVSFT